MSNNWSDIDDCEKSNGFLTGKILEKFSVLSKYIVKNEWFRALCVRKMTPAQMNTRFPAGNIHTLHLLDLQGNVLCEVGGIRAIQTKSLWEKILHPCGYKKIHIYETVEEALKNLGEKRNCVAFALEWREKWNIIVSNQTGIHSYKEWNAYYIYKTPKDYKNFAEFVGATLAEERAKAEQELAAELAEIDK
jgi:hypothetical protein